MPETDDTCGVEDFNVTALWRAGDVHFIVWVDDKFGGEFEQDELILLGRRTVLIPCII